MTATVAVSAKDRPVIRRGLGGDLTTATRGVLFGLSWVLLWTPLPAQTSIEAAVMDSARQALHVAAGDSIWLDRSYSKAFYPGAVFYRTWYVPRGMVDVPPKPLALVEVEGRILLVRSPAQLPAAWTAASAWKGSGRPDAFLLQAACSDLLLETGLLGGRTRFIDATSEIPASKRRALYPQTGLREVRPVKTWESDSGTWVVRYAWDNDLFKVTCGLSAQGAFRVAMDTLAFGARNQP